MNKGSVPVPPRQQLIANIRLRMGGGRIRNELSAEHFEFAVDNAFRRYRMRSSNSEEESFIILDVQPDVQVYQLPDEVKIVQEIYRRNMGSNGSGSSVDPFSLAFTSNIYMSMNPGGMGAGSAGTLATYELGMAYQKLVGRMFGGEIQFVFNSSTKKLFMERKFQSCETVLVHVHNHKPDEVLLQDTYAYNWLQDWATAECKMILGTIYSKFQGGLGGPQGAITLNGEAHKTEATAEFTRLEEEIKAGLDAPVGYGFIIG